MVCVIRKISNREWVFFVFVNMHRRLLLVLYRTRLINLIFVRLMELAVSTFTARDLVDKNHPVESKVRARFS